MHPAKLLYNMAAATLMKEAAHVPLDTSFLEDMSLGGGALPSGGLGGALPPGGPTAYGPSAMIPDPAAAELAAAAMQGRLGPVAQAGGDPSILTQQGADYALRQALGRPEMQIPPLHARVPLAMGAEPSGMAESGLQPFPARSGMSPAVSPGLLQQLLARAGGPGMAAAMGAGGLAGLGGLAYLMRRKQEAAGRASQPSQRG